LELEAELIEYSDIKQEAKIEVEKQSVGVGTQQAVLGQTDFGSDPMSSRPEDESLPENNSLGLSKASKHFTDKYCSQD
jgi:hypothetical protein